MQSGCARVCSMSDQNQKYYLKKKFLEKKNSVKNKLCHINYPYFYFLCLIVSYLINLYTILFVFKILQNI